MDKATLTNIGGGAACEKFAVELQRVIDNIADINTDPSTVREVTLKVKIKPDHTRGVGSVVIESSCKLAPDSPATTQVYFGPDHKTGQIEAFQSDVRQEELFTSKSDDSHNVHPLAKEH